jgi:hypothetical protein
LASFDDGAAQVVALLKKMMTTAPDEFGKAMMQETAIEAKECAKVTPTDKLYLQKSVHAVGPERKGSTIITAVVAGEPGSGAEEYAVVQHEDLDFHHDPPGQAKFIEQPLNQSAPYMAQRIAARIDLNRTK